MNCRTIRENSSLRYYSWILLILLVCSLVFSIFSRNGYFVTTETLSEVRSLSGNCYLYLPVISDSWRKHVFTSVPDDDDRPQSSRLKIFEDGKALGPPHSSRESIADYGLGRFSHWRNYVYFSSSDNSSPISNARVYTVEYPMILKVRVILVQLMLALVLGVFLVTGKFQLTGMGSVT